MPDIRPVLTPAQVPAWDREVDVAVLGQGIAGTCAALEAHRAGADVLIIERASGGGGASAISTGIFYLGGGTAVQRATGHDDSPDDMARYLMASCDPLDPNAVHDFARDSVDHFDWLEAQGVPFERSHFMGKAVFLLTTECLTYSGNEKVWPYCEVARPAPRGHAVSGKGESAGLEAMKPLLQRCADEGIAALYDSSAVALVQDEERRVVGVQVRQAGGAIFVRARRGVVISCGSHNLSPELVARHLPLIGETAVPLGIPNNDGAGVLLGMTAGVATSAMDGVIPTASIYPPGQLIKGIVVNANGQRFVAEDCYHGTLGNHVMEQPGQTAYLIVNSEIFAYPEYKDAGHALVDGWDSVEEMEAGLGLPPGALVATMDDYNSDVRAGEDRRFRKRAEWLKPLDQGPFAAFDISFDRSSYAFITLGGLRASANGEALDLYGRPVPGLYAVGASAAHIPRTGKAYASGLSLAPGSYFGRRAGRHAAGRPWS